MHLVLAKGGIVVPCTGFHQTNHHLIQPFPKRQILDSSKLKGFADDNFKLNENGRKFSKRVENTVGKKEKLLVTSNFSFSHIVFKRLVLQAHRKKHGFFGR